MNKKLLTTFAARLKELREAAGLTQDQLADRAKMNKFGIAKLEQGQREPVWATVQALAEALGLSCEAFTGTRGATEPPSPRAPIVGRPRKTPQGSAEDKPKKPRGRPRKGK